VWDAAFQCRNVNRKSHKPHVPGGIRLRRPHEPDTLINTPVLRVIHDDRDKSRTRLCQTVEDLICGSFCLITSLCLDIFRIARALLAAIELFSDSEEAIRTYGQLQKLQVSDVP
jgi:hypothetical protein